jgi:hypothetical protein
MQAMKGAILDSAPGGLHVEEIPIPEPLAGEVLVQRLSLICAAAGFCTNAGVVGLHAIIARAFPTEVRAFGAGFAVGVGRGGSVLAPIIAGFLFGRLPVANGRPDEGVRVTVGRWSAPAAQDRARTYRHRLVRRSDTRVLSTHVGSLIRPAEVLERWKASTEPREEQLYYAQIAGA